MKPKNQLTIVSILSLFFIVSSCRPAYKSLHAFDNIENLRSGVILVPLNADMGKVISLRTQGEKKKANKLLRKQQKANQDLIQVFEEHYSFSFVRYYYQNPENNEITLLDRDIRKITTLPSDKVFYMSIDPVTRIRGDREEEIRALIVKNETFIPLRPPFPGLVPLEGYPSKTGLKRSIKDFQKRLDDLMTRREKYLRKSHLYLKNSSGSY